MSVGFPALAAVVRAVAAGRATGRIARATVTALSALGEARLVPHRHRARRAAALAAACAELCAVHQLDIDLVGAVPTEPCVLVANHVSYLDPIAILAHIPAVPLAKAEVADWPIIGAAIGSLGGIFVRRDDPMARARALRAALRALADGTSVLNFPEGTTTDGRRLLGFHRGIFGAAMLAGVPVVPIALRFADPRCAWTGDAGFLPHYWWLSTCPHAALVMTVRAPMRPRPAEPADAFAHRVRAAIAACLDRRHVAIASRPPAPTLPLAVQEIA